MKLILIYEDYSYSDCGGGAHVEHFKEAKPLLDRVNELNNQEGDGCGDFKAYVISHEYEFEPVEIIKEFRFKK